MLPFVDKAKVTFIAKDYRDRAIKKPVKLDGVEFLRWFTLHILPKRFVKIRWIGINNHTANKNPDSPFTEQDKTIEAAIKKQQPLEIGLQRLERLTGVNPCICPACEIGKMIVIKTLPRIRSPVGMLQSIDRTHI